MTTADIIIVVALVLVFVSVITMSIIRRKKGGSPCSHCPDRKSCCSKSCGDTAQKSGVKDKNTDKKDN